MLLSFTFITCTFILFGLLEFPLIQAAQTGNSLVTCAACQGLQAQIDNWSCDINCQVAKGSSDDVITNGVIAELREEINNLKQKVNKLESSRCAFSVQGTSGNKLIDDSPTIFEKVDLNTCNGFNATSGEFTASIPGTYVFSAHAQASSSNAGNFRIKKNDDVICTSWVTVGGGGDMSVCSAVTSLVPGDKVKVTSEDTDPTEIRGDESGFIGFLLYPV